ncbi:ORF2 [Lesser panda anellovirus]|nr:ORF2 [Lesser panda anellovirus]ASB17087.1 ORF2 [Lesser panda anellovirus]
MVEFILPYGQSRRSCKRSRFDAVGGCRRTSGACPESRGLSGKGEYRQMGSPEGQSADAGHSETLWLESCLLTHSLWCKCNDWREHVRKTDSTWRSSTGGGDRTGEEGGVPDEVAVHFDLGFSEEDDTRTGER